MKYTRQPDLDLSNGQGFKLVLAFPKYCYHLAFSENALVGLVRNDHCAWNPWAIVVRRLVKLYPTTVVDHVPVYLLCHVVRV